MTSITLIILCSYLDAWYADQATQYLSQSNGRGCKLCPKVIRISGKDIGIGCNYFLLLNFDSTYYFLDTFETFACTLFLYLSL